MALDDEFYEKKGPCLMSQPIEPFTLPITVKLSNKLDLEIDAMGFSALCERRSLLGNDQFLLSHEELEALCRFLGGGNGIALANRLQDIGEGE